ncbi:MAG: spore coat associated protein CotJA [Eubacteriales bacterium]|nr:spore coat associated protein CotJA [Eubacteriales bacterium]
MDCSNNQWGTCVRRLQMPQPPCMNTDCGCDRGEPLRPTRPVRPELSVGTGISVSTEMPVNSRLSASSRLPVSDGTMPGMQIDALAGLPTGMAYVPWQRWCQTYPLERALDRGTIFPELDLPFMMGRCRG